MASGLRIAEVHTINGMELLAQQFRYIFDGVICYFCACPDVIDTFSFTSIIIASNPFNLVLTSKIEIQ